LQDDTVLRSQTITALPLIVTLTLSPLSAFAQEAAADGLSAHIPAGLWELTYQRTGRFKPLFWRYEEAGKSHTCIQSNPRQQLLDWITRKGCTIDAETPLPDGHLFSGVCWLKWVPGQPVSVDIRLTWRGERHFDMDIRSREHPWLTYTEHTRASLLGPCATPALNTPSRGG